MKSLPAESGGYSSQPGRRLRAIRQQNRITLDQLSRTTGLSKGFLSRVERDVTSPSVASLVTICEVLGVSPGAILDTPDTDLIPLNEAPLVDLGGEGITERLITPRGRRDLRILHAVIQGHGRGEDELYTMECTIESVHVISGEFVLQTPDREIHMSTGDTVTLPGAEPHSWRNPTSDPVTVLWVLATT
ncbi:helix-turn-helix domain-containing protein [Corynebacterium sp.]|uniref:helix-turn-helix domain-containing protein n=1 Tax=Corynebacterium sp. TaxID=1720 RepID=UPI0028A82B63|nr:helix-turn-helix domain-containing protein [Corynebacterium sp.]